MVAPAIDDLSRQSGEQRLCAFRAVNHVELALCLRTYEYGYTSLTHEVHIGYEAVQLTERGELVQDHADRHGQWPLIALPDGIQVEHQFSQGRAEIRSVDCPHSAGAGQHHHC